MDGTILVDVMELVIGLCLLFILGVGILSRDEEDAGTVILVFAALLAVWGALILSNFLGEEVIEGTTYAVSKAAQDGTIKIEISSKVTAEIAPSDQIMHAYEVAVVPSGSRRLRILKNDNSLWRLKFNKREIQLQLLPDRQYRFRVYGLLGKNILDIEEE